MNSLNESALAAIEPLLAEPEKYGAATVKTGAGVTIIDCGSKTEGSGEAGLYFSRACLAGLGEVTLGNGGAAWPEGTSVNVTTDHPVEALMASQYAGWAISVGKYFAMGSGPARALIGSEELFKEIKHTEKSDVAVLCLEARKYPDDETLDYVVKKIGVAPEKLTVLIAPTACAVGSIQISARIVETAVHKLHEIGFALDSIVAGHGVCPVAPVADDDMEAIGRTNDCVLYGGEVHITADCDDGFVEDKIGLAPASASKDHGRLFIELFREYGDFYKIDPMLFSPARITIKNLRSGKERSAGEFHPELLKKSFGID